MYVRKNNRLNDADLFKHQITYEQTKYNAKKYNFTHKSSIILIPVNTM